MLATHQSVGVETAPLDSEYRQARAEPLDSAYWEPFWAARIVYIGGIVLFAVGVICLILHEYGGTSAARQYTTLIVDLERPCVFGKSIVFLPKPRLYWSGTHPVVRQLWALCEQGGDENHAVGRNNPPPINAARP